MKHNKGLIIFTTLFSVAVFFIIFLMMWYWNDNYEDFNSSTFRSEIKIPGLKDGACPQGLAMAKHSMYNANGEIEYVLDSEGNPTEQAKEQEYYFVSAYFNKKNKASRIYVAGKESGYLGYVSLYLDDKPFCGHVGGIATDGNKWLWIGSESTVYCIKRRDTKFKITDEIVLKCVENGRLDLDDPENAASFEVNGSASFLSYYQPSQSSQGGSGKRLYVGEFYRAGKYETDKSHHVTLPDGTVNRAFMYEYNVSDTTDPYGLAKISETSSEYPNGLSKIVPKVQRVYSIPDQVQGVARVSGSTDADKGDSLIFSQSYGLSNSRLSVYNYKVINDNAKVSFTTIAEDGLEYPDVFVNNKTGPSTTHYYEKTSLWLYYVYGKSGSKSTGGNKNNISPSFIKSYSLPCMTEGLAVGSDDRVNILFESGARKYKMFVRQSINKIYSFRVSRA